MCAVSFYNAAVKHLEQLYVFYTYKSSFFFFLNFLKISIHWTPLTHTQGCLGLNSTAGAVTNALIDSLFQMF